MVTLVYHSQSVAPICRRIAASAGPARMRSIRDTDVSGKIDGTVVLWGSHRPIVADTLINTPAAASRVRDKRLSRRIMGDLCPATWYRLADVQLPCVIRPRRHYGGHRLFVCRSQRDISRAIQACGRQWYASELTNKDREYRVFVLHGRVLRVSEKLRPAATPDAVAWNLAAGGGSRTLKRKEWPLGAVSAAITAAYRLRLGWCAVDVAVDIQGRAVVFEANLAPGLTNPQTIRCIAEALVWTDLHGAVSGAPPQSGTILHWRDVVHPALSTEAMRSGR